MTWLILHRTDARWEAGERPSEPLLARVGSLVGALSREGVLRGAEGLRASREGVRLTFEAGARAVRPGPFPGGNELTAGFAVVRTATLDDAVAWATALAGVLGDVEVDVRPVTEPWDIGLAPVPEPLSTRRYMLAWKATAAFEAGLAPTQEQRNGLRALYTRMRRHGVLVADVLLAPSGEARRLDEGSVRDGPFAESKELVAGYVLIDVATLDDATARARRYFDAVESSEVEVRRVVA